MSCIRYTGAAAMYLISKKLKKKYGIEDERLALYAAIGTWVSVLMSDLQLLLLSFLIYYLRYYSWKLLELNHSLVEMSQI